MIPARVRQYLDSRPLPRPWEIAGVEGNHYAGAVVIPALAENDCLFATLASLDRNPPDSLSRFLVVVVVNNRQDCPAADRENNGSTLTRLAAGDPSWKNLRLGWVDASSPGWELPAKGGGVGLSRKIGLDLALPRLRYDAAGPFLICLDADTLVRPDYLPALTRHFQAGGIAGAVIPFCHPPDGTAAGDQAIERYELFLRAYVLGLSRANSPYAFHSVGSAMACSAESYARIGGMNLRLAAEDFYFLQQLAKTGGISQVKGTVVRPSPRLSHRVPFGTGRSVSRLLAGEEKAVLFYRRECFQVLQGWLALVGQSWERSEGEIQAGAAAISSHLADYLEAIEFTAVWIKLKRNFRERARRIDGFHGWFDGLKTMKLIHFLSDGPWPRGNPERLVEDLLQWSGLPPETIPRRQLALLRRMQIGEACSSCGLRNGECGREQTG